ncbi:hypothetical protein PGT21_014468 [Puccinia graminis f. sp. tritici]|uniref:Uncharacterized protein n=1 Tax=Puccinia graminis f. sp. tritici TaxID=56615 RepID=A0A5B0QSY9_PUCGR|nr:hypothetical protein PGT21_014468 [Puccinia graminis f. sp. tritici]KAA1115924.1 hypothetical protein PGTUg99_022579 [Puccinia graminis f. sp. tritici]
MRMSIVIFINFRNLAPGWRPLFRTILFEAAFPPRTYRYSTIVQQPSVPDSHVNESGLTTRGTSYEVQTEHSPRKSVSCGSFKACSPGGLKGRPVDGKWDLSRDLHLRTC